jgi:hypothetical protein
MSEEKARSMGENIGKRVRNYLIFFVLLIIVVIWGDVIIKLINIGLTGSEKYDFIKNITSSIIALVIGAVIIFLNIGRDIDLHNLLDNIFFHVREKTDKIIIEGLYNKAREKNCTGFENMKNKPKELFGLFYQFVNKQEELRSLAFTYWEQYFVNLYVITFSIIGLVISIFIILLRGNFDITLFTPIVFILLFLSFYFRTFYSLVPKIYALPLQQIDEIISKQCDEFRLSIKERFHSIEIT